jgi:hypothetical protein
MTLQPRDRKALGFLGVGVVIWAAAYFFMSGSSSSPVVAPTASNVSATEKRLARMKDIAATVPQKEEALKKASAALAEREKGLIQAATPAQAQAQIVQILRRLAMAETPPIDIRATELGGITPLGDAYGSANVSVQMECHVDQLVNYLTAIGTLPELISTSEMRITSINAKEKIIQVRLTVVGVVPRKLVPEKKGSSL